MALSPFRFNVTISTTPPEMLAVVVEALAKRHQRGTDETDVEYLTRIAETYIANEFKSVYSDDASYIARKQASVEAQDKITVTPIKDKPASAVKDGESAVSPKSVEFTQKLALTSKIRQRNVVLDNE